eukprot:6186795-Pleurochrysis_carterae.AAC.3
MSRPYLGQVVLFVRGGAGCENGSVQCCWASASAAASLRQEAGKLQPLAVWRGGRAFKRRGFAARTRKRLRES